MSVKLRAKTCRPFLAAAIGQQETCDEIHQRKRVRFLTLNWGLGTGDWGRQPPPAQGGPHQPHRRHQDGGPQARAGLLLHPARPSVLRRESGIRMNGKIRSLRFRGRTAWGQSVNVASERGDKPGTTRVGPPGVNRSTGRVAPNLPPLIHPLPTLRRAGRAAG